MTCQTCQSKRIVDVSAKCGDLANLSFRENRHTQYGYVPSELGIGGGDYISFDYCLQCGQIQGEFPKEIHSLEE